jgi:hypothetical protein
MSGQQNPDYILADHIILICSTVIGHIMAEEYVYLVMDLSTSVTIWWEQEQDSTPHESLTKNLKLEIGVAKVDGCNPSFKAILGPMLSISPKYI